METETIDKLFLELSQVTKAKTEKELFLHREKAELEKCVKNLLAVIHGDGGHHTEEVALYQSCMDAETVVIELRKENAELEEQRHCICVDYLNGNPDPVPNPDCLIHGTLRKPSRA